MDFHFHFPIFPIMSNPLLPLIYFDNLSLYSFVLSLIFHCISSLLSLLHSFFFSIQKNINITVLRYFSGKLKISRNDSKDNENRTMKITRRNE